MFVVQDSMRQDQQSTVDELDPARSQYFHLYGYPIAHSAAPAFHDFVFSALKAKHEATLPRRTYELFSTSQITEEMLQLIRGPDFGGASVTMPLKAAIIPHLDGITEESRATGAVNTIVKVPSPNSSSHRLIGTNTDILGVKNALLRALRDQHPSANLPLNAALTFPATHALDGAEIGALVIGGGATARSTCQALFYLGIRKIFLVNRLPEEAASVRDDLSHLDICYLRNAEEAEVLLAEGVVHLPIIVGVIPCLEPKTEQEKEVYAIVERALSISYQVPFHNFEDADPQKIPDQLPLPTKRLFLDMAYKPRWTKLLAMADAHSCQTITGIQAMLEQGYAQQRMWLRGDPSSSVGSDESILEKEVEQGVRVLIEGMSDVVVSTMEMDRAASA